MPPHPSEPNPKERDTLHQGLRQVRGPSLASSSNIPPRFDGYQSWFTKLATRAVAAAALSPVLTSPLAFFTGSNYLQAAQPVGARVNAVTDLAEECWSTIRSNLDNHRNIDEVPHIDSLWNNIQAVFHVTDDAGIAAVDKLRLEIIERGASNPAIPPRIVHGALYTLSVSGQRSSLERERIESRMRDVVAKISDITMQGALLTKLGMPLPPEKEEEKNGLIKELSLLGESKRQVDSHRAEIARAAVPFLGRIIVDTQTKQGRRQRMLVNESEVRPLGSLYSVVEPYDASEFKTLASVTIGQVADRETLEQVAQELLSVGNEVERRGALLDVLLNTPTGTVFPQRIMQQSRLWVFGREQLKQDKKQLEAPPLSQGESGPALPVPGAGFLGTLSKPNTEPLAPEIPGVPPGTKTGNLDALQHIDPTLTNPRMIFPFGRDASYQQFVAKNITLLARNHDPLATVAAAQWFAQPHYEYGLRAPSTADYTVLQALIMCAHREPRALEVLKRVGASYPDLVMRDVLLLGSLDLKDTPASRASDELRKLLAANVEFGVEWLHVCAEGRAGLIWSEPSGIEDSKVVNSIRDQGAFLALRAMAVLGNNQRFVDYFRAIVSNPFQQPRQLSGAIAGLALAKDVASMDLLLSRAMEETLHPELREIALHAALLVDTPELVPPEMSTRGTQQDPFAPIFLNHLARSGSDGATLVAQTAIGDLISSEIFNPVQTRLTGHFEAWLTKQNALRSLVTAVGGEPSTVTEAEKLSMMVHMWRQCWRASSTDVGKDNRRAPHSGEHLDAMVEYLRRGKERDGSIDLSLAAPMMMVLSKSGHPGARELLANIATQPEKYAVDESREGFFGMLRNYMGTAFLKATALDTLGGMLDLGTIDDSAMILHRVARKSSVPLYRESALVSLRVLADRYHGADSPEMSPEDRERVDRARSFHARECLAHLVYHRQLLESAGQPRLAQMETEFNLAKLADRFGATEQLLMLADEATGGDVEAITKGKELASEGDRRPLFVRSVMHALLSNGKREADITALKLDPDVAKRARALLGFVTNQDYWLGPESERRYSGKGTEVAIFDVGYVLPLAITDSMNSQVVYPERLIDWGAMSQQNELHPTMVAWTLHQAAKNAKIRTYDVNAKVREVRYRPEETQDPIFRAFEDLAELQLSGKANVDVANYSFGLPNALLVDSKLRAEFIDQMSAFMEVLSRMDVKHAVAAANGHGEGGVLSIGEVNSLGLRFGKQSTTVTQPDSVFIAAAHDAFTGRLAEFSSKQDELRANSGVRLRSFHGVNSMVPALEDGMPAMLPGNGTSFGSPNQAAMLLWGVEAAREVNLRPITHREWQEIFDKSILPLTGREPWEGGDVFYVHLFLEQLKLLAGQK